MMNKLVCNICGKETVYEKGGVVDNVGIVVYPMFKVQRRKNGIGIVNGYVDMDFCYDCFCCMDKYLYEKLKGVPEDE